MQISISRQVGLMATMLLCSSLIYAQALTIFVEIDSGSAPTDISWKLINENTGIELLSDNGEIQIESQRYAWEIDADCSECYRFEIDGLAENARYGVRLDFDWHVYSGFGRSTTLTHYLGTCNIGESCLNPEVFILNSEFQKRTTLNLDHWYKVTSIVDSYMNVNTCSNADPLTGLPKDTKLWIYDTCPDELHEGPEAAIYYNDESFICLDAAAFKDVFLPAGTEYLMRLGNRSGSLAEKITVIISREANLLGCTEPSSCNFNPFANVDDGSCSISTDCGPDLWVNDTILQRSVYLDKIVVEDSCLYSESCVTGYGERDIVRFTTGIHNIGDTDFIVGDPTDNPVGFSEDNCHDHWHQLSYAEYLIYSGAGELEPLGLKNGFCMLDIACAEDIFPKYNCRYMGITAGCFDVYSSELDCQWLDVTDLADGEYTLVVRVNWQKLPDLRGQWELDYDNNVAQVCISLDRSSGELELAVLDNCDTYVDCFGVTNGNAVFDCNGVCGGLSHIGDYNQDEIVDSLDIEDLFMSFSQNTPFLSNCVDLDQNGQHDIIDAALIYKCTLNSPDINEDHNHCGFILDSEYSNDTVWIRMTNPDFDDNTFDLEYYSPSSEIRAMNLNFSGSSILGVDLENQNIEIYKASTSSGINILLTNEVLERNSEFEVFATVAFDDNQDTICLEENAIVINKDFYLVAPQVEYFCAEPPSSLVDLKNDSGVRMYPNPAGDKVFFDELGTSLIDEISIINIEGITLWKGRMPKSKSLDIETLNNGYYMINVRYNNGKSEILELIVTH